uniref:Uncharacterized protein n=1 Tax=Tanacetum cinerariifolium TaxID=118510 RepID=A0A6L2MJI7_TANCI|nr:hypothetical protein [Tanacetum cinerariifolium]
MLIKKSLWVELKRLFEPDADDVLWKLQRYMHYPITWKLHSDCGVHQVSSTTKRHDMFMLTEKDYPLSNEVMILMMSAKLQVEEDSEMARDLVMKIFMEANKPKSRSLDTSSKDKGVAMTMTMTMAQTLIKIKAEKAKLLNEQIAKRTYDQILTELVEFHNDDLILLFHSVALLYHQIKNPNNLPIFDDDQTNNVLVRTFLKAEKVKIMDLPE